MLREERRQLVERDTIHPVVEIERPPIAVSLVL
jgi:hypothetical protein